MGQPNSQLCVCAIHLVKDLRTGYETSNVNKVMAGEIKEFIKAELKYFANKKEEE